MVIVGKHKVGEFFKYKGEWFKISEFPNEHTILAKNLRPTSKLPQQIRILITELV